MRPASYHIAVCPVMIWINMPIDSWSGRRHNFAPDNLKNPAGNPTVSGSANSVVQVNL